jgi:hypothetical protein
MNTYTNTPCFSSVWGASSTDVYVGSGWDNGGSYGCVVHYDGSSWSPMFAPFLPILGIWGASPTDIYAVGSVYGPVRGSFRGTKYDWFYVGYVLRYDGRVWRLADLMGVPPVAVWGASPADVFVVMEDGSLRHSIGPLWLPMSLPSGVGIRAIWGASPSNVFGLGYSGYNNDAIILHYDGLSWAVMSEGQLPGLSGIWGSSQSDIFAVGSGVIVHFDGSSWAQMSGGPFPSLSAVWGSGPGDVFAVGEKARNVGVIYHYGPPQ